MIFRLAGGVDSMPILTSYRWMASLYRVCFHRELDNTNLLHVVMSRRWLRGEAARVLTRAILRKA